MRTQNKYRRISVTEDIYQSLIEDRKDFEDSIGGGKWSISDTIKEYRKIIYSNLSEKDRKALDKKHFVGNNNE